jgi:hypothetical protein
MSFTFLSETKHRARKIHLCIWCNDKIIVGEFYLSQSGIYEGDFQHSKYHLECAQARDKEFRETGETEIEPGQNERPPERLGLASPKPKFSDAAHQL